MKQNNNLSENYETINIDYHTNIIDPSSSLSLFDGNGNGNGNVNTQTHLSFDFIDKCDYSRIISKLFIFMSK